jgi:membrane-associated protease RseP (regulator of RpoE activity)
LLLVADVLSIYRLISANRGNEKPSLLQVVAHKIPPPLSEDPRQAHGAIHCPCRSPAIQIFIRPDDVILRIDERVVKSAEGIDSAVTASASGVVKVTGLTQTVIVVVQFEREVKGSRLR